ncbi:hypothetical protein, partial [Gracilibacillus thailandensis]|uniref:hypothetical protein n=1 Tax=Gracilibacillus thailandensis TaxID=563735 RepID=UPI001E3123F9
ETGGGYNFKSGLVRWKTLKPEDKNVISNPCFLLYPHGKRSGQAVAVVTPNIHLKITTLYHRYIIWVNEKDRVGFPGFLIMENF